MNLLTFPNDGSRSRSKNSLIYTTKRRYTFPFQTPSTTSIFKDHHQATRPFDSFPLREGKLRPN